MSSDFHSVDYDKLEVVKFRLRTFSATLPLAFFWGCSTTPLTDQGRSVRLVRVETPECQEVGRVFAENWWDGNDEDIRNELRNQAAELGANRLVLENRPPWTPGNRNPTHGIALKCGE